MVGLPGTSTTQKTRASGEGESQGGAVLNNGEIITEFTQKDPTGGYPLVPTQFSASEDAHTFRWWTSHTRSRSRFQWKRYQPRTSRHCSFDVEGIDVSIDYRWTEPEGSEPRESFQLRHLGWLLIHSIPGRQPQGWFPRPLARRRPTNFRTNEKTSEVYRFIFNCPLPQARRDLRKRDAGLVKGAGEYRDVLKGAENLYVGRGMNIWKGHGDPWKPGYSDNSTIIATLQNHSLIFSLEGKENGVNALADGCQRPGRLFYRRAIDQWSLTFKVGTINVNPKAESWVNTIILTKHRLAKRSATIAFGGPSRTENSSAIHWQPLHENRSRFPASNGSSPVPFNDNFEVSYFTNSGRVWLQLTDPKGKNPFNRNI